MELLEFNIDNLNLILGENIMQPDLRTMEGASQFLNYHLPDLEAKTKHEVVNYNFQLMVQHLWNILPDGPGKTRFIVKLNEARMAANSCIANEGA